MTDEAPDVPTYEPETVAWNLFRHTVAYQHCREDDDADAVEVAFLAGYRAGRADEAAKR
jgi:hypothetical protein